MSATGQETSETRDFAVMRSCLLDKAAMRELVKLRLLPRKVARRIHQGVIAFWKLA